MPSLTKTFKFLDGTTEGWTFNNNGGNVVGAVEKASIGSATKRSAAPITQTRNILRTTVRSNNAYIGQTYWEYSGTWEDLGVPAGATVNSCEGSYVYYWRYRTQSTNGTRRVSQLIHSASEFRTGPFAIFDPGTSEQVGGNLGDEINSVGRSSVDMGRYPTGSAGFSITARRTDTSTGWLFSPVATTVSIPSGLQASNSNVSFRLHQYVPPTDPFDAGLNQSSYAIVLYDDIQLAIDYTGGGGADIASQAPLFFCCD